MKRKAIVLLTINAMLLGFGVTSCSSSTKPVEIFTLEELYAMEKGKSYILMNDLDLGGREWVSLSVKSFDGNGHTISDCEIRGKNCAFFSEIETLSNCTFSEIEASFYDVESDDFGIVSGTAGTISSVKVMDSSLYVVDSESTNAGSLAGSCNAIIDCEVQNCKLEITGSYVSYDSYAAGIAAGASGKIENLKVSGNKLEATAKGHRSACIGIAVGKSSSLKNVEVIENTISATGAEIVGGVSGSGGEKSAENIYLKDNTINIVDPYLNFIIGGFVGYRKTYESKDAKNMLIDETTIVLESNIKERNGVIGCVFGSDNDGYDSVVVQNSSIKASDNRLTAAGFGYTVSSTIRNSAIIDTSISGTFKAYDQFGKQSSLLFNDYLVFTDAYTGNTSPKNANDLPVIKQEKLDSEFLDTLKLDKSIWNVGSSGNLELNF